MVQEPVTQADIRLIVGDQRSGKNTVATGLIYDDVIHQMTGLIAPSGEILKAQSVDNPEDKEWFDKNGIRFSNFKYVRIYDEYARHSKIITKPKDFIIQSPVRVFSSYHLYGIRYMLITQALVFQYMNSSLFEDGWMVFDESMFSDAGNSMTTEGKTMRILYATIGKRHLHFLQLAQKKRMVDLRLRWWWRTSIECEYDNDRKMVMCTIKEPDVPEYETEFYAPDLWPYFDTDERTDVPDSKLAKAIEKVI